ncbi:MAG: methyltransferase domain-containing protein [Kiritimatiellae bacterium]|nr:methyltransferase domain-containing protein [Kiritimatiellia bacterium]
MPSPAAPLVPDSVERNLLRLPLARIFLKHLEDMLGPLRNLTGLDLGGWGGALSAELRRRGGAWTSMDAPGPAFESLRKRCGDERIYPIERLQLPFADQSFDVVIVVDLLQHARDEDALVQELHRVLRPAGQLIIQVPRLRSGSVVSACRRLLRIQDPWASRLRAGYTPRQLFAVLKNGFDVQDARSYGRPWSHLFDLALRAAAVRRSGIEGAVYEAWAELARTWMPAAWAARVLDAPLLLSRGHRLLVRAKRRLWIPRHTPVLRDGRSIAEATLQTRIGTASTLAQLTAPRGPNQVRTRR